MHPHTHIIDGEMRDEWWQMGETSLTTAASPDRPAARRDVPLGWSRVAGGWEGSCKIITLLVALSKFH